MSTPKRIRTEITLDNKRDIIKFHEDNNKLSHEEIKNYFNVKWNIKLGRSTITTIINNRDQLFDTNNIRTPNSMRIRNATHPSLDNCLFLWFSNLRAQNICLNDHMLVEQAKKFGECLGIGMDFKYSSGYIRNFKERHGLKSYKISGESKGVDPKVVNDGRIDLVKTLSEYSPENVYNFDETALFYRLPPNKTLACGATFGNKESKERISIGLCVNASGTDKCKPIVIAKYARPRCFGKLFDPDQVVFYYHNNKAWMTMVVFKDWLKRMDSKMKLKNKKIILLLDNAASHNLESDVILTNIRLKYLPPNTTSVLQPLDAGIIRSFKCIYKNKLVESFLNSIELNGNYTLPDIKQAIYMVQSSWSSVSLDTIVNCWSHCRIFNNLNSRTVATDINLNLDTLNKNIKRLNLKDFAFCAEEYVELDNTIPTGEILSVEDIVAIVNETHDNEDNEDHDDVNNIEPKLINNLDAKEALKTLKLYFEQQQLLFNVNDIKNLNEIEIKINNLIISNLKQDKLERFVKRKLDL